MEDNDIFDDDDFEVETASEDTVKKDAAKGAAKKPTTTEKKDDLPRFTGAVLRSGHIAIEAGKELSLTKLVESIKRVRDENPGNPDVKSEATRWLTEMLGYSTLDAAQPAAQDVDVVAEAAAGRIDTEAKRPLMQSSISVDTGRNTDENSQATAALQAALGETTKLGEEDTAESAFVPEEEFRELGSGTAGALGADNEAGI